MQSVIYSHLIDGPYFRSCTFDPQCGHNLFFSSPKSPVLALLNEFVQKSLRHIYKSPQKAFQVLPKLYCEPEACLLRLDKKNQV